MLLLAVLEAALIERSIIALRRISSLLQEGEKEKN
jgi:hypothetical protein